MVMGYFKENKKPKPFFERLKMMSLDNLYLLPECSLVMKFALRAME